jgi:hypothetical protein
MGGPKERSLAAEYSRGDDVDGSIAPGLTRRQVHPIAEAAGVEGG